MIETILKYFQPVAIHRQTKSVNSVGEPVKTYALHITVDGLLRPLPAKEQRVADQNKTIATHRLYCRPADILTTDRIVESGKTYQIVSANDVMAFGALMQVDCYEVNQ
jgi:head-tail adaptor